ncbi:MAG: lipopolysaccharide heptosyltransferase II [Thermodesulfobacteriota bacterium]|nr:lipopolysaccharide heptosyltransferase II [Thermodesulfobacteriota bacterium]
MSNKLQTIVVFCPNWVGDVVMATPVFECLRINYAGAKIIGVIRKYASGVVKDGPWFDSVIELNDKNFKGFFQAVSILRSIKPDIAFVLPNSFRSSLIAFLGGAKKLYGYQRNLRSIFLSGGPKPLMDEKGIQPVPMVEYYLALCHYLNLIPPVGTQPKLFFSKQIEKKGAKLLNRYGIKTGDMVVGMNPGAKFGSSKCWPAEYFAEVAKLIKKRWDCKILLLVGPGEDEIAESILESSSVEIINTGPDKVDLALLKYMIKNLTLLITNDTGPRHYGVAFDIPVVVIMGSTNPAYTAANLEKTVVLRKELDCSPCHEKKCPLGHHKCMTLISPEYVMEQSIRLLEKIEEK